MKKLYTILSIILFVTIISTIFFVFYKNNKPVMVGGDRDDHGCIPSAGYSWCPSTAKCQRMWEEYCEEYKEMYKNVESFVDCVATGSQVFESYPRQCYWAGKVFVEDVGNVLEKMDLITLESPLPNDKITSPIFIKGQARGTWFFEGSFPIVLVDWDGRIVAQGVAQAETDWMTTEFVPFTSTLSFVAPTTTVSSRGALIFKKDNPSGLPVNDDALEIPISF